MQLKNNQIDKIKMFSSGYGESFLVSLNSNDEGVIHILIDCGFGYSKEIRPQLQKIDKLKRFIITHYDKDHIQGAYNFLNENGDNYNPKIINIEQLWLNTYRHLQFDKANKIQINESQEEKLNAFMSECNALIANSRVEENISAEQAVNLGSKIIENKYLWNTDFNELAIIIENKQVIPITNDISIILLSPNKKKLKDLKYEFEKAIYELINIDKIPSNEIFDDAFELFVLRKEYDLTKSKEINISAKSFKLSNDNIIELSDPNIYSPDLSESNGSSIAFILKTENKKILFLADANSEIIEDQLKILYPNCINKPLIFDAIKISHHGAQGNNSPSLLKLIDSKKFLISTNGKHPNGHKHPDQETIARIINRPIPEENFKRELFFNYKLENIKPFNNIKLKNYFHYNIVITSEINI